MSQTEDGVIGGESLPTSTLVSIPLPTPTLPASEFDRVGGETAVRELVDRFYDLMDLDPGVSELRALHAPALDGSRDKLFWFLCGWLGGPQHYAARFGHPMLRARHMAFRIGIRERDQWLACMRQAMNDQGLEPQLAQRLDDAFFKTADWMRNRGI